MSRGKELIKRNSEGLMAAQVEYLKLLAEGVSDKEARDRLNLSNNRVGNWRRKDEAFIKAYDAYSHEVVESVQTQVRMMSDKAAAATDELLGSMKPIKVEVTCPKPLCGHTFKTTIQVQNANVRAKVIEMVMKATGILKDVRKIEGEIGVTHMTAGQRMALGLWDGGAGARVSEAATRELVSMGLLEEERVKEMENERDQENTIEGEFREV